MLGALGRIVQHDPRSRAYPFKAPRSVVYASVQHASHIGVLDQGDLGSCTGNATVGALGCDPFYDTLAADTQLNENLARTIYSTATTLDDEPGMWPPTDTGSSGLAAAKAAKNAGFISGYQHAFDVDAALAALQSTPVITGIDWYSSFDEPGPSGLVTITASASIRGGHELAVTGYDAENGLVWMTNSWGPSWGVKGRFCMAVSTWATLLKADGDATILVPVTAPAPVPTPPSPVPDPGAATFPVSSQVRDRVVKAAAHRGMNADAWVEAHFRHYFGI